MRFSALALAEESRVALDSWSSCGLRYRRAVPLMGLASTTPSADPFKNLSGEEQHIWQGSSASGSTVFEVYHELSVMNVWMLCPC